MFRKKARQHDGHHHHHGHDHGHDHHDHEEHDDHGHSHDHGRTWSYTRRRIDPSIITTERGILGNKVVLLGIDGNCGVTGRRGCDFQQRRTTL